MLTTKQLFKNPCHSFGESADKIYNALNRKSNNSSLLRLHRSSVVRRAVATDSYLSLFALNELCNDPSYDVQYAIIKNEKSNSKILERLRLSSYRGIRFWADEEIAKRKGRWY